MPIAIIVEDGSNVPNANSYVDIAEYRDYAASRGIALSSDDNAIAPQLIGAMDYLEIQPWKGAPTYASQSLAWPRAGVYLNGALIDDESIPKNIRFAQMQLAIQVNNGVDLFPVVGGSGSASIVKREKVGPLETEYDTTISVGTQPYFRSISALLAPYTSGLGFGQFRATRG